MASGFMLIPFVLMIPTAILVDISDGGGSALTALLLLLAMYLTFSLGLIVYYVVSASYLWSANGQGWHDRFAGTIVVVAGD